jgi:predicted transposase YdaD
MGDHDLLFKRAFRVPAHAAAQLRALLPQSLVEQLDLSALSLEPASFVDPEMAERHSDLLFRAPLDDVDVYLYFLFEHQSEPDPLMPYRVLGYVLRIWEQLVQQDRTRKSLPVVVPLIVHHGDGGWTAPRRLHDLLEGLDRVPEIAHLVPDVTLLLDDLHAVDDAALRARPLPPFPKVALWVLRDARDVEALFVSLAAWAGELERLVRADPEGQDIQVVLRYILRVAGNTPFETLRQRIVEVAPALSEPMATAAEELFEQGKQQGIQQGLQQGLQQGAEKTLRATLGRLLRTRFGEPDAATQSRIATASVDELDRWLERVVTAETLDGVFEA